MKHNRHLSVQRNYNKKMDTLYNLQKMILILAYWQRMLSLLRTNYIHTFCSSSSCALVLHKKSMCNNKYMSHTVIHTLEVTWKVHTQAKVKARV